MPFMHSPEFKAYLSLFYHLDQTDVLIERARKIKVTGATGAYDEEFETGKDGEGSRESY